MPIASVCSEQGCNVLTIGPWCIEHDPVLGEEYERGRPFHPRTEVAHAAAASRVRTSVVGAGRGIRRSSVVLRFSLYRLPLPRARDVPASVSRSVRSSSGRIRQTLGGVWTARDERVRARLQA